MGFIFDERLSDSPYLETITRGRTVGDGSTIRPAETHWHMVMVRFMGSVKLMVVGPLTTSGVVSFTEGAELLWIKFKLGTFMPHLPARNYLDGETTLPEASGRSFWLKGCALPFPDFENAEVFINRLVRSEVLARDPAVGAILAGSPQDMAPRTVRHHFLRATGMTLSHIRQVERAQQAAALLRKGVSILDTVFELGYFDQPHLTRSLKQYVGYTPAQIRPTN